MRRIGTGIGIVCAFPPRIPLLAHPAAAPPPPALPPRRAVLFQDHDLVLLIAIFLRHDARRRRHPRRLHDHGVRYDDGRRPRPAGPLPRAHLVRLRHAGAPVAGRGRGGAAGAEAQYALRGGGVLGAGARDPERRAEAEAGVYEEEDEEEAAHGAEDDAGYHAGWWGGARRAVRGWDRSEGARVAGLACMEGECVV